MITYSYSYSVTINGPFGSYAVTGVFEGDHMNPADVVKAVASELDDFQMED